MKNLILSLLVILLLPLFALVGKGVEPSLILYFSFDEVKGDKVTDKSENNHTGTLQGDAKGTEEGKYNNAISFDGAGDLVRVEYDKTLDLTGSFTVMAWMYPTLVDGQFRWVIDKSNTNADLNYLLGISSNNQARFITRKLTNDVFGPVVSPKKWYHIAGVQDENSKKIILYLDGAAVASKPLAGEKTVNNAYLSIGCRKDAGNPNQFFGGIIDEVAMFTRALTDADIQKAMNGLEGFLAVTPSSRSLATTWSQIKTK